MPFNLSSLTIKAKALITLVVVMVIVASMAGVVLISLDRAKADGDVINDAGRQRMLSQAMAKSILGYNMTKAGLERTKANVADMDSFITAMRSQYTQLVVKPAKAANIEITMDPAAQEHPSIPFPATFTRMVNEKYAVSANVNVDIISADPINPDKRLKDATDQEAYQFLINNPKEIFFKSVEEKGALYLRYYTNDVASVQGCASCHTNMTGTPYKVGDMLGIRKFSVLFSNNIAAGKVRLNPSLKEYETASTIFTRTLAAFKSGGSYPADLKMTKDKYFAGSPDQVFQSKITEIEKELVVFDDTIEKLNSAKPGSQAHSEAQQKILSSSNLLRKLSNDLTVLYTEAAHANQSNIAWAVVVLVAVVLLAFVGVYLFLGTNIVKPLNMVIESFNSMAEGDMSQKLNINRHDELGDLAKMFNNAIVDVGSSIVMTKHTSEQLKNLAGEMLDASSQTGDGVRSQAAEVEQAASAINEMSATVEEMANNASLAAEAAVNTQQAAGDGQQIVGATIDAINTLASEVKEAAGMIQRVEDDSSNITTILDTIRGIAEQTNLLALNAAIEAARAGEHGRGFAVVADEVRALASRTQESTVEIQGMIERLQKGTQEVVQSMTSGTKAAEMSVGKAAEASNALEQIVDSVAVITDMNNHIATATEELGNVTMEVNKNIVTVNDVAQSTAAVADNSYESSNQVAVLSAELSTLLNRFKVNEVDLEIGLADREVLFQWSDAFDVGVEEVNRQHKVLIGILNELYNLLQNERSLSAVHRMLTGLVDYAVTHFSYEEHLMQKFGYPDFESHKRSHEALMTQLGQFMQQVDAGDEGVAGELLEFIKAWLVKHIQGVDMEYGPFLNEKGIR